MWHNKSSWSNQFSNFLTLIPFIMLSELLPEEKKRLHDLEQQLAELEHGNTVIQTNDISLGLEEMATRLDELDKLVQKESKLRKDDYRRRVQHLRTTHNNIKT